jgi:hypothetical protein
MGLDLTYLPSLWVMNQKTKLTAALNQVDNIIDLLEDNEWKGYMYNHLSPVKYELERQLSNLSNETN